jgi:ATP-dependent DNA helicase RecG
MSDLDNENLDRFFKKIEGTGRYSLTGDAITDLSKLNLLKNDNALTHAAKLLFAKEMTLYSIHIGRFKTPSMIIDDKMVQGTLFEAVEEAYSYILSHIKVAFEFTGELSRNEILEYPKEALRELLLNAVIHRDYTSPVDIQIKIFDNSIMFFNPGKLYGDLTVEKLKTDTYKSRTRNKLIAEAFYLTGDIEKYGTGYIRVRKAIRSYPTMSFKYFEDGDGYTAELSYNVQKTDNIGVNGGVNLLIEIIKSNPGKRTNKLAELAKIPPKTCEKWLTKLRQQNKIEFRGAPKTGGYFVKE